MKSPAAIGLCFGALACVPPESGIEKPRISVYRIDPVEDCYEVCQDSAVVQGVTPSQAEECTNSGSPGEARRCVFEPGRDFVWVLVDYDATEFDPTSSVPDIELTTLLSGASLGTARTLRGQRNDDDVGYATTQFLAPSEREGDLRFLAKAENGFSRPSIPFRLATPQLAVSFSGCDETCEFPANSGEVLIELDVPRGLETIELVSKIGGVQQTGSTSIPVSGEPGTPLVIAVPVPDRPLTEWSLVARRFGFPDSEPATASIVEREPLEFGGLAIDGDPDMMLDAVFPARLALEPQARCREVQLVVRGPQSGRGQQVTLETTAGLLGASGRTITIPFGDQGVASTTLELGRALVPGASVELSAASEQFGTVRRTWRLADLTAGSAEIFIPGSPQQVGEAGTPSLAVTGVLRPPSLVAPDVTPRFTPGTEVVVQVTAQAETEAGELACGIAEPAGNIRCDRRPGVDRGGCTWTANPITVSPDGSFLFDLPAGRCFSGSVSFQVFALPSTDIDTEACLGPQVPAPEAPAGIELIPLGNAASIVYTPKVEESEPDADSGG